MLAWLASLISGPVIGAVISGYKAKLEAGNTQERIAADLAARELEVQKVEIQAQNQLKIAEIGHWYEPEKLFEYTLWSFYTKCLVYDKMLGLGSTDPLYGAVGDWSGIIIVFLFGKRGIENVVRILKR